MSASAAAGLGASGRHALTVDEVLLDPLTELANKHWAPVSVPAKEFKPYRLCVASRRLLWLPISR